ncbi:MAG TPA: hypothetical protein VF691_13555 [Cytophagaceae bacterium]|jgi:hypothetical protein
MIENLVVSEFAETWLEDGLVIQVLNQRFAIVNLEMALQLIKDRKSASAGAPKRPVLVDVGNVIDTDKDAKRYYREEGPYVNISAIAIVTDNFIALAVGSIVFKLKKNPVPVEFFNDRNKAKRWLNKFK